MSIRTTLIAMLLGSFAAVGCQPTQQPAGDKKTEKTAKGQQAATAGSTEKVPFELYIMSKCPYGAKSAIPAVEAMKKLDGAMDLKVDYIAREEGNDFKSLHGPTETAGNIYQLCARQQDQAKFYEFLVCTSESFRRIPDNSQECANKVGLDFGVLKTCAEGEEGKKLLRESIKRATAARAMGSPTIKVNGKPYRGGRSPKDFMRAVCAEMKNPNAACAAIPPPVKVAMTVLTDKRCKACQTKRYETQLQSYFPGLEVKTLDYGTDEGKALYQKTGVDKLPALLFDESVTKAEAYKQFQRRFQKKGDMYLLPVRATFDPTAEICDNKIDDTGNGKIDCADETCKDTLVCREEKKGELAVFVMSQCPYGVRALDAMKPVIEAIGDNMKFKVHFIASKTDSGFKALHGQSEVDENIRELCAIKHYPKKYKYMDYIWCRNKNIRSNDWQSCTGSNGIDTAVIQKCFEGEEGKKLLEEDIKHAEALGISASPTWLANNRHKFSGIQAERIKTEFCKHNPGTKGCEKKLADDNKAPVPAGACGN